MEIGAVCGRDQLAGDGAVQPFGRGNKRRQRLDGGWLGERRRFALGGGLDCRRRAGRCVWRA